jgi:hypothetical protein
VFYTVITTELETIGKSIPCMILHGESDYIEQISFYLYVRICNAQRIIQLVLDQIYDDSKVKPHQYEFARLNLNYTVMQAKTVAIGYKI